MSAATTVVVSFLFFAAAYDLSEPYVAVNRYDTCLVQFGQAVCFGRNNWGQLGRGNNESIGDEASELELVLYPIDLGEDFIIKRLAGGSEGHHCREMHRNCNSLCLSHRAPLRCFGGQQMQVLWAEHLWYVSTIKCFKTSMMCDTR